MDLKSEYGGMVVSRGEVDENREFVCSPRNGNARWTRNDGRESVYARRSPIRVMGKSIRGRASSKVAGQGVADT